MIVSLYAIPKLTLYPILLLAFGLGLSAKVAFGVLHGVIPIILFTLSAVHNTKPILIKTGRVLKLSRWQMVRWILFPAAVPEIFTGLRVGFALTLIGSLLAEMFASQRGLGYLLMNGIGLHNVELIMSVTLVIVVFAFAVSSLLLYDRSAAASAGVAAGAPVAGASGRQRRAVDPVARERLGDEARRLHLFDEARADSARRRRARAAFPSPG